MDVSEATFRNFARGTPIYALGGEKLGLVGKDGVLGMYLTMREGRIFRRDVAVPVSAIDRADVRGVYLNRTRGEIHDLTLGGWSSLGNFDLNTGRPADSAPDRDDAPLASTQVVDAAAAAPSSAPHTK